MVCFLSPGSFWGLCECGTANRFIFVIYTENCPVSNLSRIIEKLMCQISQCSWGKPWNPSVLLQKGLGPDRVFTCLVLVTQGHALCPAVSASTSVAKSWTFSLTPASWSSGYSASWDEAPNSGSYFHTQTVNQFLVLGKLVFAEPSLSFMPLGIVLMTNRDRPVRPLLYWLGDAVKIRLPASLIY